MYVYLFVFHTVRQFSTELITPSPAPPIVHECVQTQICTCTHARMHTQKAQQDKQNVTRQTKMKSYKTNNGTQQDKQKATRQTVSKPHDKPWKDTRKTEICKTNTNVTSKCVPALDPGLKSLWRKFLLTGLGTSWSAPNRASLTQAL